MICTNPIRLRKNLNPSEYPDGLLVPCGKCLMCRIQKRKEWTARLIHEMDNWQHTCFVTFTYNKENVPSNGSLCKQDLQKLFKRLRQALVRKNKEEGTKRNIKYFACGEYGENKDRPHYHAIILGVAPNETELLDSVWGKGFVHCGTVTPDSIQYVNKYIHKKYSGELEETEYKNKGLVTPFKIQSTGIGKDFVEKNKEQLINNEGFTLFGVPQSFPRYYIKKLGLEKSEFRKNKSIDLEKKYVEKITGIECTDLELYKCLNADDYMKYYEDKKSRIQLKSDTVQTRIDLTRHKL